MKVAHILETPTHKFIAVGSVPLCLMTPREPTISDIMGGRVHSDGFAYIQTVFETVQALKAEANLNGVELCQLTGCACRKYDKS